MDDKIYKYLLTYGFLPVNKGFKLILESVKIILKGGKSVCISDIYKKLSEQSGMSVYSVQKNIKNAAYRAELKSDIDLFNNEFGYLIKDGGGITAGALIHHIAEAVSEH